MQHREACVFGSGFFRIKLKNGMTRFCQDELEVARVRALLEGQVAHIYRDGYCLDPQDYPEQPKGSSVAVTQPVYDGATWLSMPMDEAMTAVGITDAADYRRAYESIAEAVAAAQNRASQTGVLASVVIKRRGVKVTDI